MNFVPNFAGHTRSRRNSPDTNQIPGQEITYDRRTNKWDERFVNNGYRGRQHAASTKLNHRSRGQHIQHQDHERDQPPPDKHIPIAPLLILRRPFLSFHITTLPKPARKATFPASVHSASSVVPSFAFIPWAFFASVRVFSGHSI
jgi:hypothetical protein